MLLKTECRCLALRSWTLGYLDADQPFLPSGRGFGRLRPYSMRVVPELLMEGRTVPDGSVDLVRLGGVFRRIDVRFNRPQQGVRRIRVGAENRLAANHDKLVLLSYLRS